MLCTSGFADDVIFATTSFGRCKKFIHSKCPPESSTGPGAESGINDFFVVWASCGAAGVLLGA